MNLLSHHYLQVSVQPLISVIPSNKKSFIIIDAGGNASINNIVIQSLSADYINGSTGVNITSNYNSLTLISNTVDTWYII